MKARATRKWSLDALEREDAVLDSGTLRGTLQKMTTIELRLYRAPFLWRVNLQRNELGIKAC